MMPALLRHTRLAWGVFAAAFLSQLLVLIRFSQSPHFLPSSDDMKFYNDWALRIASGVWTDGQAFYGLPGYAYALAGIYSLVGFDPFIIGAIQALIFSGVAVVVFLLGVRLAAVSVGLIAAFGWVLFVPAQAFSVILMPTIWLIFTYWALVLWVSEPAPRTLWKPWLIVGIIVGGVAVMVATVFFVLPLVIVAILRSVGRDQHPGRKTCQRGISIVVLFAGVFLGTAPAWVHNHFVAHEPVFLSAHSGINFWIGNNPVANGYPRIPPGLRASQQGLLRDSVTLAQTAVGRELKRYEVSQYWNEKTIHWIRNHRFAWLRLMWIKVENSVNALQYDDLSTIKLLQTAGVLFPGVKFGLVAALGVPGLIVAAWRLPRGRWIAAAVLLHLCALLPVFVTERYRLAAVPGLLLGAAYSLWCMYHAIASNRSKAVAGAWIAAGTLTVAFVTIPRGDPGVWSLDHYKAGIRALELGEMGRAQNELETAYAYVPTGAEINFALGNYWFTKRDLARAKVFYRRALELDSSHASAYNNLAVIMIEERRWDWAEKFLLRALQIEPDDGKALYLLARARYEAGKLAEASEAISAALQLTPDQQEFLELQRQISAARLRN